MAPEVAKRVRAAEILAKRNHTRSHRSAAFQSVGSQYLPAPELLLHLNTASAQQTEPGRGTGRAQQKAGKENLLQITITGTTHKSVALLFDVVIRGLVFMKQKHAAAVGLPVQQGSRKLLGVCISEQGYKKIHH